MDKYSVFKVKNLTVLLFFNIIGLKRLKESIHYWKMARPIFLCYAAASPLRLPFPIDFSCTTAKMFLFEDLYHD